MASIANWRVDRGGKRVSRTVLFAGWGLVLGLAQLAGGARAAWAEEPQWIWLSDAAGQPVPVLYARKVIELSEVVPGELRITADNRFEVFVNGARLGEGGQWERLHRFNIQPLLKKGRNVIAVRGQNSDGPAGLLVDVRLGDKPVGRVVSDGSWKVTEQGGKDWKREGFDDRGWAAPRVLGRYGITPWGEVRLAEEVREPAVATAQKRPAGPLELIDGDRVVLLGDTLVERMQRDELVELALTARFAERNVIFRNLGWSGDTVFGEARAGFGSAADGFRQLRQQVLDFRPTVIFVAYGNASSFEGEAGLPAFLSGYATLLDTLAETGAVLVLVSPTPHEALSKPLPDPGAHNRDLRRYADAIRGLAAERELEFVDLFTPLVSAAENPAGERLTDNGVHFTKAGYARLAQLLLAGLKWGPTPVSVRLTAGGATAQAQGIAIRNLGQTAGGLQFTGKLAMLPVPGMMPSVWQVERLPAGEYELLVDSRAVARGSAGAWAKGLHVGSGPDVEQAETLRNVIRQKNMLFFHRWRPQNETYLFGFRKHEQGQNAREIPMFDPLVAEKEQEISKLRLPAMRTYELRPAGKK